jgi:hypothetical protein
MFKPTMKDSKPGKKPEVDFLVVHLEEKKPEVFHRKMREKPEVCPLFIAEAGNPWWILFLFRLGKETCDGSVVFSSFTKMNSLLILPRQKLLR